MSLSDNFIPKLKIDHSSCRIKCLNHREKNPVVQFQSINEVTDEEGGVRRYPEPCYERPCIYAKIIEQQEGVGLLK